MWVQIPFPSSSVLGVCPVFVDFSDLQSPFAESVNKKTAGKERGIKEEGYGGEEKEGGMRV